MPQSFIPDKCLIAGIMFHIHSENKISAVPYNFKDFMVMSLDASEICESYFRFSKRLEIPKGTIIGSDYDVKIIKNDDNKIFRLYHAGDNVFAVNYELKPGVISEVVIKQNFCDTLKDFGWYFHLVGWEKMMICHDRMLFHASCIDTRYGGILFSGVSGIGKSTQADLWETYRDARQINGDRPILHKEEEWRAYGSPFAGSSKCHVNDSVSITAIVMLRQGQDNKIRRLNISESFHQLYSMATVYTWDKDFIDRIIDMVSLLSKEVPIYQLTCTPDEGAVIVLEQELKKICNCYGG